MDPDRNSKLPLHKRLITLFLSTLCLSAFTFGGGYVIISLYKNKFVDELGWMDEEEMLDLVAIAQGTPGIIAVNGAILVGFKIAGIPGIICSTLGALLPPFFLLTIVSFFYDFFKDNEYLQAMFGGMRAGVCAVITSVVFNMTTKMMKNKSILLNVILLAAFIANYFFGVNVIVIMVVSVVIGFFVNRLTSKVKDNKKEIAA
ncbi:MAG: chromate transporter [Butyrivibrio sp.]|nr:chromate transporter [Butyrivibrio sp.]